MQDRIMQHYDKSQEISKRVHTVYQSIDKWMRKALCEELFEEQLHN